MTDFTRQRVVTTEVPQVLVDPTLPPGLHEFELVVADESGQRSRPVSVLVEVVLVRVLVGEGGVTLAMRLPTLTASALGNTSSRRRKPPSS